MMDCYMDCGSQAFDCSMVVDADWVVGQAKAASVGENTEIAHLLGLRFAIQVRPVKISMV